MSEPIQYGLWDTKDKCWLGTADGPWQNSNWDMARLAAAVASEQLEITILGPPVFYSDLGNMRLPQRVRCLPLPKDKFHCTGETATRMTSLQAIQNIEGFCEIKTEKT